MAGQPTTTLRSPPTPVISHNAGARRIAACDATGSPRSGSSDCWPRIPCACAWRPVATAVHNGYGSTGATAHRRPITPRSISRSDAGNAPRSTRRCKISQSRSGQAMSRTLFVTMQPCRRRESAKPRRSDQLFCFTPARRRARYAARPAAPETSNGREPGRGTAPATIPVPGSSSSARSCRTACESCSE